VRFVKSQDSAVKSADQRLHRRRSSVSVESESESDEKHSAVCRRRVRIKPDKFDGVTPRFATFKAQFVNVRSLTTGIMTSSWHF